MVKSEHQNSNFNQRNNFKLLRLGAKCVGGGAAACVVVMVCSLWLPSIIETTIWWVMEPVKPTGANLQHHSCIFICCMRKGMISIRRSSLWSVELSCNTGTPYSVQNKNWKTHSWNL